VTGEAPAARGGGAAEAVWRRTLRRLGVDLRPGEGSPAALLFASLFLLLTFQIATKTIRQSTFIDALGAARLPLVYLLVALVSYPVLRLYNRFVDRYRIDQLFVASCVGIAGSLVVFWALMRYSWTWVPVVFYVGSSIVYGMLASQFWLLATHLFDPRQARRLFGFIGAGALLGGVLGGQVARLAGKLVGTSSVLLVAAVLLVIVALLMMRARSSDAIGLKGEEPGSSRGKLEKAKGGFEVLRQSRPLQTIAAVVILTVMVAQVVDLQFNWAVEQSTTTLDQRTAFYGNFFSVMGIAAFVFQLAFTSRIHRRLGISFALRVLPVTMAIGTVALLLAAGFVPEMLVAAALILKVGESGLRYSLDQSTRELLFLPVPSRLRVKAKAFIDVFIQRGAKGLSALLLLPVTFGVFTPVQAGWISLVLIAIWLSVTAIASREYVRAFRVGLKQRTVDASVAVDLSDVTTLELLLESLGSSDRRQVLHCLDILAANGRGDLVPPLLLYHDEPEVRLRTLGILADLGRVDVAPLIERRLGDSDPEVRAEAIRVLAGMQGKDVCQLMLPRLEEGDPGVRAAAVACLANYGDEAMTADATRVLLNLLADAEPRIRIEAVKAIGAVHEPLFQERLIQSLYDSDVGVIKEAVAAIRRRVGRDGFNPLYVPTLIALLQNRRVRHEAREALVAFGESTIPMLVHFMNHPDEPLWVKRALPKAIAQIGTMAAAQALLDGLRQGSDSFLRRKQVEALTWMLEHNHRHALDRQDVQQQIREEARRFLRRLAALRGLGLHAKGDLSGPLIVWSEERVPTLLDRLLAERAASNLWNVFGLLALLFPPEHIWAAHRSLTSGDRLHRSRSLEFLDNTLEGELSRAVFAVIDDCPLSEKLTRATKLFDIRVRSRVETLRGLLEAHIGGEPDSAGIAAAALYEIRVESVPGLEAEVEQLAAGAEDPFVGETATWVAERVSRA